VPALPVSGKNKEDECAEPVCGLERFDRMQANLVLTYKFAKPSPNNLVSETSLGLSRASTASPLLHLSWSLVY